MRSDRRPADADSAPSEMLAELQAQHDELRAIMDRCMTLADELDATGGPADRLADEVARLREGLETHNAFEERLLRPALLAADAFGAVRVDRMVEDHVGEHRALFAQLHARETRALRDTIELLRAHLEAEERYLLSPRVLRDDVVNVEAGA